MQNSGNIGGSFSLAQWISANKLTVGIGVAVATIGAFGLYMYVTKTTPTPNVLSNATVTDAVNPSPKTGVKGGAYKEAVPPVAYGKPAYMSPKV